VAPSAPYVDSRCRTMRGCSSLELAVV
jgi:hypothetical protein